MNQRLEKIVQRLKVPTEQSVDVPTDAGINDDLVDLTAEPFVTIDNPGSRDLDQALLIEPVEHGWRVRYAIADASYFVRPGTALFDYALERGASYYLPGFALPMLPRTLSEGIVSLNPDVIRRAVVFDILVGEDGEVQKTALVRAKIRSCAKLTYDGVQRWFDAGAEGDEVWAPSVRLLRDLGECRAARARARGVIEYDRNEAGIEIVDGRFTLRLRKRNDVERWNEQLSLLCNTEGARLTREADAKLDDLQSVYRVHLPPLQRRLSELRRQIATVCDRHDLRGAWRWDGEQPLAEYLRELPEEPWRPRRAIELQIRYTNRASEYSDRVGPHFALAVEQYARFSAPMREIVGIFTHKEALEALGLSGTNTSEDDALRDRVIEAGNESRRLQKRIDKEVMLLAIGDLLDADLALPAASRPTRRGTIVGLRASRVYVLLDALPLELKVYTEDLEAVTGASWTFDEDVLRNVAESLTIGDGVALRVAHYDEARRRYVFEVERLS